MSGTSLSVLPSEERFTSTAYALLPFRIVRSGPLSCFRTDHPAFRNRAATSRWIANPGRFDELIWFSFVKVAETTNMAVLSNAAMLFEAMRVRKSGGRTWEACLKHGAASGGALLDCIRSRLTRAGAQVIATASGPEALEAVRQRTPGLVITDVAMPHMDGYTLARKIRVQLPKQKIVGLSAFPAGRAGMADIPFDSYLFKPIEPLELVDAVAAAV